MTKKNFANLNQLKVGAFLTYLSMAISLLVSLFFTPYLIGKLGNSEYGVYNLALSIISYLSILSFGFGTAYIKFYSRFKAADSENEIEALNGLFLVIFSIIAVISFICGLVVTYFSDNILGTKLSLEELKLAKIILFVLTINMALKFPNIVFNSYIRAKEKFIFEKTISIAGTLLTPLIMMFFLLSGFGSIGVSLALTIVSLAIEFTTILYSIKKLRIRFKFKRIDKTLLKELVVFSVFIFVLMIIDQINWNLDRFLLGRFVGSTAVAVYSVALLFNTQYMNVSVAISGVFTPRIHRIEQGENKIAKYNDLFLKVARLQFMIILLFLSGFIVFGKPFIIIWVGADYLDAYYIAIILLSSVTIPLTQNIGIEILQAMNLHKIRTIIYTLVSLLNIILTLLLIQPFGGVGAALGTAISLFFGNVILMNIFYFKKVKLDIPNYYKNIVSIFIGVIAPLIFGYTYISIVNEYQVVFLLIGIVLYTIIYCLSIYLISMNYFEKQLIKSAMKIIMRKIK